MKTELLALRDVVKPDKSNPNGKGLLRLGYMAAVDAYFRGKLTLKVKRYSKAGKRGYNRYFISTANIDSYNLTTK